MDRSNTISVSRNVGGKFPLDCRCVVDTYADLIDNYNTVFDDGTGTKNWYVGMIVYCVEKDKLYTLKKKSNVDSYSATNPNHHEWAEVGGISQEDLADITDSIAALNTSVQGIQSGMSITTSGDKSYKTITLRTDDSTTTDVDESISINVYDKDQVYNKSEIDTGFDGKLDNTSYLTNTDIYGILGFDQIIFSIEIDGTTYNTDTTMIWNSAAKITNFIGVDIDDEDVLGFDVYYSTDLEDEKKLESFNNVTFGKFIVDNTNPLYIKFYIKKDTMKSNSIKISFNTTE